MGNTSSALHEGHWIHQIVWYFVFSVWVNEQLVVPFPRVAYLMFVCLTVARQVPLSMGFSRQEYWRG